MGNDEFIVARFINKYSIIFVSFTVPSFKIITVLTSWG